MGNAGDSQLETKDAGTVPPQISVDVASVPVLSYALAHNGIPIVSQLVLTGSGAPVRNATVRIDVRDAEGSIGTPVELFADVDPGHTTVLTDVGLRLDPSA